MIEKSRLNKGMVREASRGKDECRVPHE